MRTRPSGSSVAVWLDRAFDILPVGTHIPLMIDSGAVVMTDPIDAVIVEEPSETPVVRPVVRPTVATDGVLDVHVATFVTSVVLVSE